jgi:hypothetical protein
MPTGYLAVPDVNVQQIKLADIVISFAEILSSGHTASQDHDIMQANP